PDQQFAIQAGFTPLLLVWLLAAPPLLPLEFTYAGPAKIQSSGQLADALDLKGPHNFSARLYLDQQTHQVLMLTCKTRMSNQNTGKQANRLADSPTSAEMEGGKETEVKASEVELRWVVSDYRNVNGLNLPHRLTRAIGG